MKTLLAAIALLLGSIASGCLVEGDLKVGMNMEPATMEDGWQVSTPEAEGFDEVALSQAYEYFFSDDELVTGLSLLVVRNDKLVAEGYTRGRGDRTVRRDIQSATKSFTSLVFGITKDRGHFDSLDERLHDVIPEHFDSDPKKREITLRHLLTMTSGLDFDNHYFNEELLIEQQRHQLRHILAKPLYAEPGSEYWYRNCDPQLLAAAVAARTGQDIQEIAEEALFGPLGITDYTWTTNVDGDSFAPQALFLRPRDMAKVGRLVLHRGNWEGQQLVSEAWIDESTTSQIEFAVPGADIPAEGLPDYGFYWWVYEPSYPDLPDVRAISAVGVGGQYIFIVPQEQLIIVMTGEPYVFEQFNIERDFFPLATMIIESIEDSP